MNDQPGQSRIGVRMPAEPLPADTLHVVGIGASAGGLEACRRLLDALPSPTGVAFVLVQHLDPSHESLLVELLAPHTALTVTQASDGVAVEAEHLYVIPPGAALAVRGGRLRLSRPAERHGARMPFDFLLRSLAGEFGARAMAVVLSGTGEDGCQGVRAIRERDGYVAVQDPKEAGFSGMPEAAIATGVADAVLPVAAIPAALLRRAVAPPEDAELRDLLGLLRRGTSHDFGLYKTGTLRRRTERRMGLAGFASMAEYLALLRRDPAELTLLAKDMLIHVTGFFRDAAVFDLLRDHVLPEFIAGHEGGLPLRIWVPGCSTGEETWSLAMLFQEAIAASGREIRLQIFASDVEAESVATARHAFYADALVAGIPAGQRDRHFEREDGGWRVRPELRAKVVFAAQDVLVDPPFSRLDMVSCRNLLIYLRPEAQARVIALFHFALRPGGLLLLGASETVGGAEAGFEPVDGSARIWRRGKGERRAPPGLISSAGTLLRLAPRPGVPTRQARLADLAQRLVLDNYAPAAVLVDAQDRCIHAIGPTERWLGYVAGAPSHDLFAMVRPELRTRLRAVVQQARDSGEVATLPPGQEPGVEVRPVAADGEALLLVCFHDAVPQAAPPPDAPAVDVRAPDRVAELERELAATRAELRSAIRNLEQSADDQRAASEEALSVNEEFQSANEELLTSKEELQSLNEELTALNGQLQETLNRSSILANDLQNVLYSTEVATLFLDRRLRIRFFTPAVRAVFSVLPGDVGRPLADLRPLAADPALIEDAAAVLAGAPPRAAEAATAAGTWFSRQILPYRAMNGAIEGVVLTFTDISERRAASRALEEALRQAEIESAAKSQFLAAVSHDLRQPLQTLALQQAALARSVKSEEPRRLVERLKATLEAMAAMLDTLLDIHRIDAGVLRAAPAAMPLAPLLERLAEEFAAPAAAKGIGLRALPCSATIRSDPALLEQILRNLLSNAIRFTREGRVLLGCRRRAGRLVIEVWDSGGGIADPGLLAAFDGEGNGADALRERAPGFGLGLSIVRRLAGLLGHPVRARSRVGRGSVFAVEVPLAAEAITPPTGAPPPPLPRRGTILLVAPDADQRELLAGLLESEGHRVVAASESDAALAALARSGARPDLVLADDRLDVGLDGAGLAAALSERLGTLVPALILAASAAAASAVPPGVSVLTKPARPSTVLAATGALLPQGRPAAAQAATRVATDSPVIHLVDPRAASRAALRRVLQSGGWQTQAHGSAEAFLAAYRPGATACLVLDASLPEMSGFVLLERLRATGDAVPVLMLTGFSDVPAAVAAIRAGATDFLEKPVPRALLLDAVSQAMDLAHDEGRRAALRRDAAARLAALTPRQRLVLDRVLAGHPNKNIAADLGISQRTVESHRAEVMQRMGVRSLPALVRLVLVAGTAAPEPPR
jgi:two-component system CheB/CheR fusion protein